MMSIIFQIISAFTIKIMTQFIMMIIIINARVGGEIDDVFYWVGHVHYIIGTYIKASER